MLTTIAAMNPEENIVTVESMLIGYTDAAARFDRAAKDADQDPIAVYNALFEVLNWAVALDDRVGEHWRPDGGDQPLGFAWRDRLGFRSRDHGRRPVCAKQCPPPVVRRDAAQRPHSQLPTDLPARLLRMGLGARRRSPEPGKTPRPNDERIA